MAGLDAEGGGVGVGDRGGPAAVEARQDVADPDPGGLGRRAARDRLDRHAPGRDAALGLADLQAENPLGASTRVFACFGPASRLGRSFIRSRTSKSTGVKVISSAW